MQIAQLSGGSADGACWAPHVSQMNAVSRAAAVGAPARQARFATPTGTGIRTGGFGWFAPRSSRLVGSSLFFVVCIGLVLAWAIGLVVGASDRFESAAVGLMSSATRILVAVLKNSELRTERTLQTKLDAIAGSLLEDRRGRDGDAVKSSSSAPSRSRSRSEHLLRLRRRGGRSVAGGEASDRPWTS